MVMLCYKMIGRTKTAEIVTDLNIKFEINQ